MPGTWFSSGTCTGVIIGATKKKKKISAFCNKNIQIIVKQNEKL